ncbi:hypothetical protein FHS15_000637 [Paenibacillus castaneae]|uniref:anti-sigma factor C-terminal domain-containing protein n=1 Tax=Paenibacillus castaneae TaxID=474957 RepID=UPI00141BD2AB|nr:anti-sigma factor C-terminal domain-containing protein [Paenibacillus castaneae]NIK75537.1 hypothetical protein [Paenibacillus castaneae]
MSEKFKQQLKDYADGKLSTEEQAEIEREIAKLEAYQEHMDELLQSGGQKSKPQSGQDERSMELNPKKAKQLMKQGKRRARYWSVGTVFGLLLLLSILNSAFISLFYSVGTPNRMDIYRDVIRSSFQVTIPNFTVSLSSSPSGILGMKYSGTMTKQIGSEWLSVGTYAQSLRLNQMLGSPLDTYRDGIRSTNMVFYLPEAMNTEMSGQEWARLEKLPEGTVAEAFVSFDQYYKTDAALKLFEGKEMDPLWLAVYKGELESGEDSQFATQPIGFPISPMWHYSDGKSVIKEEKKNGWFSSEKLTLTRYPSINLYGDGKLREDNFKDTLRLLQRYKSVSRTVVFPSTINQALDYVEANGVSIYGIAVTGPVKEILKLREASFVKQIRLGEVRLWNWNEQTGAALNSE